LQKYGPKYCTTIAYICLKKSSHYLGKLKIQIFYRCGRKRKQIAYLSPLTLLLIHKLLIFLVFKIASLSPYWLQIKFSMSLFFCLLCDQFVENSSQQTSLQCLTTINMVFTNEDKILIKSLYLMGYTPKWLTEKFPEKSWTKHDANKMLKTLPDTGGQAAGRPHGEKKIAMPLYA